MRKPDLYLNEYLFGIDTATKEANPRMYAEYILPVYYAPDPQTKLESLIETIITTMVGFFISWIAWPIIAHVHGMETAALTSLSIVAMFTILSLIRGYVIRRWCQKYLTILIKWIAVKIKNFKDCYD